MTSPDRESKLVLIALVAYALFATLVAMLGGTTFDDGDSLLHYEFARHAFAHPENLLDLWAKPVFTMLSAPFAYIGDFAGMRLFNFLCGLGSVWLVYRSARLLKLPYAWLAPVILMATPQFFLAMNSGLTEPLFGLFLSGGLWLALRGKYDGAAALISFLPFVRSEGFLIVAVYFAYLVWIGRWRSLPWTGLGFVLYGIVGLVLWGDFMWVFTRNPYENGATNYGAGSWAHFFIQYQYVVGLPIYILTALGLLRLKLSFFIPGLRHFGPWNSERTFLIYAAFVAYFGAHVVFWATGKFHSLGLIRVMVAIAPVGAIIALDGIRSLLMWIPATKERLHTLIPVGFAAILLLFPFSGNNSGFRLPQNFIPSERQMEAVAVADFMRAQQLPRPYYYASPSLHMELPSDPFDSTSFRNIDELGERYLPKGAILIWDSWFSAMESGVSREFWDQDFVKVQFELLQEWKDKTGEATWRVYRKISEIPPDA